MQSITRWNEPRPYVIDETKVARKIRGNFTRE